MLAGYNLESGMLPASFMRSPGGTNGGELNGSGLCGLDTSCNIDPPDRKRSVSFAPVSTEEDLNRISIGKFL